MAIRAHAAFPRCSPSNHPANPLILIHLCRLRTPGRHEFACSPTVQVPRCRSGGGRHQRQDDCAPRVKTPARRRTFFRSGARSGTRTRTAFGREILSLLRLPISPSGRNVHAQGYTSVPQRFVEEWRPGSESNRRTRLCRPLHDHSATWPYLGGLFGPQKQRNLGEPRFRPETGAGNETRTRDPDLGKVVLYQLSYSRKRLTSIAKSLAASTVFFGTNVTDE